MININQCIFSILLILNTHLLFAEDDVLKKYQNDFKKIHPDFKEFSAAEGESFFRTVAKSSRGENVSCMTCHTENPKSEGKTRANKIISPMAKIINPERFTDYNKVEKWFKRNCNDVFERECTLKEKGNFLKFMISIK